MHSVCIPYFPRKLIFDPLLVATQAERDSYKFLEQQTRTRVAQSCAGELEREVNEILGPIGVPADLSRQVANALLNEEATDGGGEETSHASGAERGLENGTADSHLKFESTIGLTPFLLQFGQGVEPVPKSRMYSSAFTIGLGYLVGGLIPLLPYFFIREYYSPGFIRIWRLLTLGKLALVSRALFASCVLTVIVLLIFGVLKAHITGAGTGTSLS